jgi:hypothetical protein
MASDREREPKYQLAVQLYEYRWNRMGRKGQMCRVLARGKMNSCSVEFVDGFRAVTSRNALRKLVTSE